MGDIRKITVIGTSLQRYVIEAHYLGDDVLLIISNPEKNKTIVKMLLREEEREALIEALRSESER
ncbi:hypothetical protein DRO29_04975 [Candidatus Bathyarchaeota archaeon]|nr:MAG: hypothetical protein DRO29_04975 [Candidatus Bathyarchaeota archaeon]